MGALYKKKWSPIGPYQNNSSSIIYRRLNNIENSVNELKM
jgi:hypothetical protein